MTASLAPDDAATTCTVPHVVGMVHQNAQDTMQAAGLYVLLEEDATGQNRILAMDRNWRTTAQSVAAGQVVDCTTTITLSAKKLDE
ncbi:PASTA domain-containing protein [Actinokineospora sp. G85]|uniref:PASTA domain-containing protein n=1 Tax=Actinokineospora sp. G85 TaxID=3406626 RepID=UPI003C74F330